jgi:putative transposase
LAVVVDGANCNDDKLLAATLDGIVVARPVSEKEEGAAEQHLFLDAGYDSEAVRKEVASRGYEAHIRPREKKRRREDESITRERRPAVGWWSGHTRGSTARRLLVRWEKKTENYLAFVQLACAQLIFSKLSVSG